jgi:uncharacterized protein (TIGR02453 family)
MTAKEKASFSPALFTFLRQLERNNRRDWFQANKSRYETEILEPALQFISDFGPHLGRISPHFAAVPKKTGGSLFRIYRDTRFAKDKRPYKTQVGIRFPHKQGRDVHAPGFYLHLEPDNCFVGVGLWHPDPATLKGIRDALVGDPSAWRRMRGNKRFREGFQIGGESLTRPPRGYPSEHPLIEDLKRKDFVAYAPLSDDEVVAPGFLEGFSDRCRAGAPLVRYLCGVVGIPF